ncbi:DUF3618 domain-containing protein [Nonomuraea africana]|uniref:DUF3618 domain-containing protein n=1 Tax=Nonomuraea africana TaxID=46171 RepID=A0ABR9K9K7_9ACTN|nr:DUF3618 domain-containing protein [Nonomuraea africana]MBE1558694.1 hypothetical protein [Nonomuraea africana]
MTESDPGFSQSHAGDVGSRRATVGEPTDHESINVPPTLAGAVQNARDAQEARAPHEEFVPEGPVPDERVGSGEVHQPPEIPGSGKTHRPGRTPGRTAASQEAEDPRETAGFVEGAGRGAPRPVTRRSHGAAGSTSAGTTAAFEEEQVRKDITETRKEIGDTVEAMVNKADVKGRATEVAGAAKDKVAAVAEKMPDQVKEAADKVGAEAKRRPALMIAAAGAVALLVIRRMMRRSRK